MTYVTDSIKKNEVTCCYFVASYPDTWDEMKDEEEVKCFLIDSFRELEEYERVQGEFNLTLPQYEVVKIYRVQNKALWGKYFTYSQKMLEFNDGILNEKLLFHGTRDTDPKEIIQGSTCGFDMRYSGTGLWGRGTYFAENASYSHSYAYNEHGLKKMFAAWVLTGISYESRPDSNITVPPPRDREEDANRDKVKYLYDTVTGVTGGTRVYITYDNDHTYPAYLIVYKN